MQKFFQKWFGVESKIDADDAVEVIERVESDDESGATAIEYGLIAALIAVAIIGAVSALGTNLEAGFEEISTQVSANT